MSSLGDSTPVVQTVEKRRALTVDPGSQIKYLILHYWPYEKVKYTMLAG